MNILINNTNYFIKEVKAESENLIVDGIPRLGSISFDLGFIYIADYLPKDIKLKTLIHELTHAGLIEFGHATTDNFSIEHVCELFSCFSVNTVGFAKEYMKIKHNV